MLYVLISVESKETVELVEEEIAAAAQMMARDQLTQAQMEILILKHKFQNMMCNK